MMNDINLLMFYNFRIQKYFSKYFVNINQPNILNNIITLLYNFILRTLLVVNAYSTTPNIVYIPNVFLKRTYFIFKNNFPQQNKEVIYFI